MAISEQARRIHDELFPGRVSTLAVTDPELVEYFDNFAFDEVLRTSRLATRTRLMVQLASMIACEAVSEYRVMLGAALTVGVTAIQVKEIVYQAVPYVGMAKVFDFIHATNDVLIEHGIELPLAGQSTTTPETRLERGLAVQTEIIGAALVEQLYTSANADAVWGGCEACRFPAVGLRWRIASPLGARRPEHAHLTPIPSLVDGSWSTTRCPRFSLRVRTASEIADRCTELDAMIARHPPVSARLSPHSSEDN